MLKWRSVTGAITVEFVFSGSEYLYQDIEFDVTMEKCDRCYYDRVCVFSVRVSVLGH